jgi:hypothetical protein
MENAWTREIDDITREFNNVDVHTGLSSHQVRLSLEKYGKNGTPYPVHPSPVPPVVVPRFPLNVEG